MHHQADPPTMTGHHRNQAARSGGHAKFIGRVGALALFLGVGTAIALPASAMADDGGADSPSSSSAASGSSGKSTTGVKRASARSDGSSLSAGPTRKAPRALVAAATAIPAASSTQLRSTPAVSKPIDAVTGILAGVVNALGGAAQSSTESATAGATRRDVGTSEPVAPSPSDQVSGARLSTPAVAAAPAVTAAAAGTTDSALYPTETNPISIVVNALVGPFLPYTAQALTTSIDMFFTYPINVVLHPLTSTVFIAGSVLNGFLKDVGLVDALPYADTGWVTLHGDPGNKKDQPDAELALDYDVSTALGGASILAAPTILPNGNIAVTTGLASGGSNLHVLDREGNIVWESTPWTGTTGVDSGAILSSPIIDKQGNIFVSDGDQLWSYTQDGDIRWVTALPAPPAENPFAPGSREINPFITAAFTSDGSVFGVTAFGQVVVVDSKTGELVAPVYQIPGPLAERSTQPVPPGAFSGGLVDPTIIDPIFQVAYGGIVRSANTPAVDVRTGRIFVAATDIESGVGALYAFDIQPATPFGPGKINVGFVAQMGPGSGSSPTLSPDGKTIYASDNDGILYAFDTRTGKVNWSTQSNAEAASVAVGSNGNIYVLTRGSVMAAFDSEGVKLWDADVSELAAQTIPVSPVFGAPAFVGGGNPTVVNGAVVETVFYGYYTTLQGQKVFLPVKSAVVEFDPTTGKAVRNLAFTNGTTEGILNIAPDGTMFVSQGAITSSSLAALAPFINPLLPAGLTLMPPIGGVNIFTPVSV